MESRHMERLRAPLPHQSFKSFEHVLEHYKNADVKPLEGEYIIDSTGSVNEIFQRVMAVINSLR